MDGHHQCRPIINIPKSESGIVILVLLEKIDLLTRCISGVFIQNCRPTQISLDLTMCVEGLYTFGVKFISFIWNRRCLFLYLDELTDKICQHC